MFLEWPKNAVFFGIVPLFHHELNCCALQRSAKSEDHVYLYFLKVFICTCPHLSKKASIYLVWPLLMECSFRGNVCVKCMGSNFINKIWRAPGLVMKLSFYFLSEARLNHSNYSYHQKSLYNIAGYN